MIIDTHAHIIPKAFFDLIKDDLLPGISVIQKDGIKVAINFGNGQKHPVNDYFCDFETRMRFMDEKGIDVQIISVSPRLFFYEYGRESSFEICRRLNDSLLNVAKLSPDRQRVMGTVPLAHPDLAVEELKYLRENGVKSVQIGTFVCGENLSEPKFYPFFEAAERLGMTVMIHPLITNDDPRMAKFHISNLVGNPWQTTVAAENLIFSGIFDRLPELKIMLVHAGGFLPYQIGRMEHGWKVRDEARENITVSPREIMRRSLYFDALAHDENALSYLVGAVGEDNVLYGSDYPYDMAEYDQVDKAKAAGLSDTAIEKMSEANAKRLFDI